jgi:hypothetical protein
VFFSKQQQTRGTTKSHTAVNERILLNVVFLITDLNLPDGIPKVKYKNSTPLKGKIFSYKTTNSPPPDQRGNKVGPPPEIAAVNRPCWAIARRANSRQVFKVSWHNSALSLAIMRSKNFFISWRIGVELN